MISNLNLCKCLMYNNELTTGLVSERCFVCTYSLPPVCNLSLMLFLSSASFILFLSPGFGLLVSTFGSIILISLIRSFCNGPSLPALSSKDELLSASKVIIKSYIACIMACNNTINKVSNPLFFSLTAFGIYDGL